MTISLVIPVYYANPSFVKMTRKCIKSAELDRISEVIVVNDGSPLTDGFDTIIRVKNSGYVAATNDGLTMTTGDIIIVGNNDLFFYKGWTKDLLLPIEAGYDIATCWTSDQENKVLSNTITEDCKFGALFAMKREVYTALGGFDPDYRDYFADLDFQKRAEALGYRVGRNNNMIIDHLAKATFSVVDKENQRYIDGMTIFESKWGYVE